MTEASIADRMEETARLFRSPLNVDRAGQMTEAGALASGSIGSILSDLATIPATTVDDALALTIIMRDTFTIFLERGNEEPLATEALSTTAAALMRLHGCLAGLSGRKASDMEITSRNPPLAH